MRNGPWCGVEHGGVLFGQLGHLKWFSSRYCGGQVNHEVRRTTRETQRSRREKGVDVS